MAKTGTVQHEQLLLRPREAARSLSISERQLWQHTQPRGPIPVVRVGKSVRYSVAALEAFCAGEQHEISEPHWQQDPE